MPLKKKGRKAWLQATTSVMPRMASALILKSGQRETQSGEVSGWRFGRL